ncbi:MAG: hypothetical protein P8M80_10230 [Pirellulaceae bacterium]|nr:hypothetical protein [Pirellulaceae bacterium]
MFVLFIPEAVDDQITINKDRVLISIIEVDSPAKSSCRLLIGYGIGRIFPDRNNRIGTSCFCFFARGTGLLDFIFRRRIVNRRLFAFADRLAPGKQNDI